MRSAQFEIRQAELKLTTKRLDNAKQLRALLVGHFDEKILQYIEHIKQVADNKEDAALITKKVRLQTYYKLLTSLALDEYPEELSPTLLLGIFEELDKYKADSPYAKLSTEELLATSKRLLDSLEKIKCDNLAVFYKLHWEDRESWTYEDKISAFKQNISQGKITVWDVNYIDYLIKYLPIETKNCELQKQLNKKIGKLEFKLKNIALINDLLEKQLDVQLKTYLDRIKGASKETQARLQHFVDTSNSHYDYLQEQSTYDYLPEDLNEYNIKCFFQLIDNDHTIPALPFQEEKATKCEAPQAPTTGIRMFAPSKEKEPEKNVKEELAALNALLAKYSVEIKENPASKININEVHYRIFIPKDAAEHPDKNFFIALFKSKSFNIIGATDVIYKKEPELSFYCIKKEKLSREQIISLTTFISSVEILPPFPHLSQQVQHKLGRAVN